MPRPRNPATEELERPPPGLRALKTAGGATDEGDHASGAGRNGGGADSGALEADGKPEDADEILNVALRCMRKHLEAISTEDKAGKRLMFNEPVDVARFVTALGSIATKRKKRQDEELGGMSLKELMSKAAQIPELREAVAALGGGE